MNLTINIRQTGKIENTFIFNHVNRLCIVSFIVSNNAWRHVSITRNSATGAVVFYINGVQSGSATSETGNKTLAFTYLGRMVNALNYNGLMDEVRIYSSVQTAAQVLADFKYMSNTHLIYNSIETGP